MNYKDVRGLMYFWYLRSSFELNDAPLDVPDMFSKPGTPCKNYKGYCDVFQKCREVSLWNIRNMASKFYYLVLIMAAKWSKWLWTLKIIISIFDLFFPGRSVRTIGNSTKSLVRWREYRIIENVFRKLLVRGDIHSYRGYNTDGKCNNSNEVQIK